MAMLTNEQQLDKALERYYNRYNKYNTKVLEMLGKTIKEVGQMKPSEVHRLGQELKYSDNIDKTINELAEITDKSIKELDELFEKFAKENVEFAKVYEEYKDKKVLSYDENVQLQRLVESMKTITTDKMRNLSNTRTVGFHYKDQYGNVTFKGLKQTYQNLIDEGIYNVSKGVTDYYSAMRNVMNSLADSGIRTHEDKIGYKSGYSRRIDSAIRQNILDGMRDINQSIQDQIGNEIGADGVEISVHFPCAEDHLDIQGKQYTKEDFKDVQDSLVRPIGEYNCRHFIMSVVLGIDQPQYSENALFKLRQRNNKQVEYEGKKYNKYEATQVQRKLETAIRKQKDRQIVARASGDKEGIRIAQQKITELTTEYNKFSKAMDVKSYKERMTVSGYHRVKVS